MYDLVDRSVDQLAADDRATLMAMRRWVHALTLAGGAPAAGDGAFGAAMLMIDRGSHDDLAIGRPCQPIVGESEAVLVSLWRLVARGERAAATALAAMIVAPEGAARLVATIADSGR